jgi:hypothetical protein
LMNLEARNRSPRKRLLLLKVGRHVGLNLATRQSVLKGPIPQPSRRIPKTPAPAVCPHLGDEIRREPCPSCRGTVLVKIHGCELHCECTLSSKRLPGVRNCGKCPDRP